MDFIKLTVLQLNSTFFVCRLAEHSRQNAPIKPPQNNFQRDAGRGDISRNDVRGGGNGPGLGGGGGGSNNNYNPGRMEPDRRDHDDRDRRDYADDVNRLDFFRIMFNLIRDSSISSLIYNKSSRRDGPGAVV